MTSQNLFHNSKSRRVVHKIAFTGIFLGLVLLLQFLSRYMPFADTYININLSLLFILPIFYYSGLFWGILVLLLRLFLGPTISGTGYATQFMVGHLILFICSVVTIVLMYIFSSVFSKMQRHNLKVILIIISTLITTSLILTILNQIFFTPLFWYSYGFTKTFSISQSIEVYQVVKIKFFMIPNYWVGTFVTYFLANLTKYGIIFLCYFPLSKVLRAHSKNQNETWNKK